MALNHRALQRTLFRMQLDAGFGQRLRAGDPAALCSTQLGAEELALVRAADPAAVAADRDGARRAQFLRNVGSEFQLSLALLGAEALESFPRSLDFHRAVERNGRLPLALGRHLARCARGSRIEAIATLERCMARARRHSRSVDDPPAGSVVLSEDCLVLELPAGTLDFAAQLREALDRGGALPAGPALGPACERLLIRSGLLAVGPHGVEVEGLSPALGRFLCAARRPLAQPERAALAAELDASPAEIEELASELAEAWILVDRR